MLQRSFNPLAIVCAVGVGLTLGDDCLAASFNCVRATMPETVTAAASVNANCVNSAPVRPPWKPIGT